MQNHNHKHAEYYSERTDSLSIQVARKSVGIAVREAEGFRFFACDPRLLHIDGQFYSDWVDASRAAHALMRRRK